MLKWFQKRRANPEEALTELFGEYALPNFQPSVMEILSLLRDPESDASALAEQIRFNPGLSVRVLQAVNSAATGLSRKIPSIEQAISLLGRSRLESMVLSVAVHETLRDVGGGRFDSERFWRGSVRRAALARRFAATLHPSTQSESFAAGLLQDMAVPILMDAHGGTYAELYNQWMEAQDLHLEVMEQEQLGVDHASIGGLLAAQWKLPSVLVDAIAGHHEAPSASTPSPSVHLVACVKDGQDVDEPGVFHARCMEEHELSEAEVLQAVDEALEQAAAFEQSLLGRAA